MRRIGAMKQHAEETSFVLKNGVRSLFSWIAGMLMVVLIIFMWNTKSASSPESATVPAKEPATNHVFRTLLFGDLIYDRSVYIKLPNIEAIRNHFLFRSGNNISYNGIQTSFQNIAETADFVWLNLETSIGRFWSGTKEKNICARTSKSIAFCSHEDILPVLKELWFTMVNLANNHTMDAWVGAHLKTIELLQKYGIKYFGFVSQGSYFESNYVYTGKKNGQLFAWHGFDYTVRGNLHKKYCASLQTYKSGGYSNFVVVHRWPEYTDIHSTYEEEIAKKLLACGADMIFGWHPHVIQDTATYSGKTVFYSLWNFLFDQYFDPRTQLGGYAIVDYDFANQTSVIYTGTVVAAPKK